MFSKAIIATDLSKASYTVVECVKGLVPEGTKHMLLLQCIKPFVAASMAYSESSNKMELMMKEQVTMLEKQGFQVESEVAYGSVAKEVNRIAAERDYAYIIVGSHGESLAHDVFLGSTAARIIHAAQKPVLLVRLKVVHDKEGKEEVCELADHCGSFNSSILFPTDFSKNADKAFSYLEHLVSTKTTSVTLLHVQDMAKLEYVSDDQLQEFDRIDTERLESLKVKLLEKNSNMQIEVKIVHGKPSMEIINYANKGTFSSIIMGKQGKGYVKELLLGSVSHSVASHTQTSVFLVPGL